MFRDDRSALAAQNEELHKEIERLRAESGAMRRALVAIQRGDHPELVPSPLTLYRGDLSGLPEGLRAAYARHDLEPTPVWLIVLLHVLTFGLSSVVHFARMSERLPQLTPDDPGAVKAALGFFIPYYNLYWLFAFPLRLADRINLQFRLRGQGPGVSRGMLIAAGVVTIPLYFLFPIAWLIPAWRTQRAINALCALGPLQPPEPSIAEDGRGEFTGLRVSADTAPATTPESVFESRDESLSPAGNQHRR